MNNALLFSPKAALIFLLGLALSPLLAHAQSSSAEAKGLEIVTEADRRNQGWQDSRAEMRMVLKNAYGDSSERLVRSLTLEVEEDGDKSLTIFDEPRDVKGTAFLSFSHAVGPDDQWLYLPALKRVKRISSRNKSGPFMGSEFAYEDMSSFEIEKYRYRYLKNEEIDGLDHFVVESVPVDEYSGYSRLVTWYDTQEYLPRKTDYYDRKNSLLKTLTFNDYQQYLDKYWRSQRMEMVNHQTGKSTVLHFEPFEFRTGLDESDFNKNSLKRIR